MPETYSTEAALHRFLSVFDGCCDSVFFVQIGTNDGQRDDPLRPFVLESAWSGVMVEPVPYVFDRLRRYYAHRADLTLVNAAITDRDGSAEFYCLAESDDDALPYWYDQLGSFSRETILDEWTQRMIPDLRERIVTISVSCLTFETLCVRYEVGGIDVIHIDAEGHDYEILRNVNTDRYRPAVIIYEHKHLGEDGRAGCRTLLEERGYVTAELGYDVLCVRQEILDSHRRTLGSAWQAVRTIAA